MANQAGDYNLESRRNYDDFTSKMSKNDTKDHNFAYPVLLEEQIRKLALTLEPWKAVVVPINSVFLWEKHWHPLALIGASTVTFMLYYLIEPSILTVASLLGLCITICDYFHPFLISVFSKLDKWSAKKEREFEELCTNLIIFKAKLELAFHAYYRMRTTNRKAHFVTTIVTLVTLAYVGCMFNNLGVAFMLTNFVLLYPGMKRNQVTGTWFSNFQQFINKYLKEGSGKMEQVKKEK